MAFSNRILCSLFLALCLVTIKCHDHHTCGHDNIEQEVKFIDIEEETAPEEGRLLASGGFRIYTDYDYLQSTSSSSYVSYFQNNLIPPIIDYFQSALTVKYPVSGNLLLKVKSMCGQDTPSILQSGGVPADLFIYYVADAQSGTQLTSSQFCYLSTGSKRPIVAKITVNSNTIVPTTDVLKHEQNTYIMMHEMIHILGLSSTLFGYYIDANGNARTGHIKSVSIAGATHIVIDVPPLTQKLRDFYGCASLPGAIMENNGGSLNDPSHFESRYFLYEVMTARSIEGRRISQFSLALLEGTGWYTPDYSYAEPFFYGQGQGCDFINTQCSSTPSFSEYCGDSSRGCAAHGRGGGYCFSDPIMDGCKFYSPNENYDCENEDGADNARLPDLQVYGRFAGSKCFDGTLNTKQSSNKTSFCFKYTCSGSGTNTVLSVQVGNQNVTCSKQGTATVNGYLGVINCPDPLAFCNTVGKKYCPRNCMGRGTCVNGTCQCKSGYSGLDCALKA